MAKRRNSNRRRRRGSFGFLYKLLSMLVICGVVVVALTLFFRVDTVVVTGQQRYTSDEIAAATGVEEGDNLFLMNKYDVANRILKDLPYIEQIRINRKLPDTLLIEVRECGTPLALIQDDIAWIISPTGKIVDQKSPAEVADYGKIDGCQLLAPSVGTHLALSSEYVGQQESLLELLSALEEVRVVDQVNAIHLEDLSVLSMDYGGRFRVELPYNADYAYKLQYLLAAIGNEDIQSSTRCYTVGMTRDDGKVNFIEER